MEKANLKVWVTVLVLLTFYVPAFAGTYSGGDGTEGSPYLIADVNDINEIGAHPNDWDKHFVMTADINMAGTTYTTAIIAPDTNNLSNYYQGTAFTGVFDGNDYKITGLTIDDGGASNDFLGLFGLIDGGQVSNLGLEGNFVGGRHFLGGLVGRNYSGSVSNCYSTGSVSGTGDYVGGLVGENWYGSVSNCYSTSSVSGTGWGAGGLMGRNFRGGVSNCYSTGSVTETENYCLGGLIGENVGSVSNCYSTGSVGGTNNGFVGGLVGYNHCSISNCYSTGEISGTGYDVGGLVGNNYNGSILNCFWDVDTQTHGVTNSIGYDHGDTFINVEGLTTTEMQTLSTFTSAGWDFIGEIADGTSETWQMPGGGGYPVLSFFEGTIPTPLSGSGTPGDPYLVGDANELGMVVWYFQRSYFRLTDDINLSGISWSVAVIPVFDGSFDGAGHVITNMRISGGGWIGLFGFLGQGSQVNNLGLEDNSVSGIGDRIGGLMGENFRGGVSNCYSTGSVTGTGNLYLGGLIGENWGRVSNCYSTGSVSGTNNFFGGLMGYNRYGSVSNCYSTSSVSGTGHFIGGLVGSNYESSVSNCFWDINSSGQTTSAGGEGKTTVEMMQEATFTSAGWDFVTPVWDICDGTNYPRLSWQQLAVGDFLCPDGVNFIDYSFFANHWLDVNCGDSNDCDGTDLDQLGTVDMNDLKIFVENWLVGVE